MYTKKYETLDALRGVAALFVLTRHTGSYWADVSFFHAHIAVDLFFILSGFVISHAYDEKVRIGAMSTARFMLVRLIRLYPLFFLATLFSIAIVGFRFVTGGQKPGGWLLSDIALSAFFTLLFLPSKASHSGSLFPLNGPFWSLFFELIVNFLYALFRPFLSNRVLTLVVAGSGICTAVIAILHNSMDFGFTWGIKSMVAGLVRTIFGFSLGLLLHKVYVSRPVNIHSSFLSLLPLLAMSMFLAIPDVGKYNGMIDCIAVFLVFPLCVYAGASVSPTSMLSKPYIALGIVSYPLYVLHVSLGASISDIYKIATDSKVEQIAPMAGVYLVIFMILFSLILDKYYDRPVRQFFSGMISRQSR